MDFLGTTTPADVLASVTTGVQTTGLALWGFLVFIGIGLAFIIGGYLISFIRASVGRRKKIEYYLKRDHYEE
jgi:hypothetical protein